MKGPGMRNGRPPKYPADVVYTVAVMLLVEGRGFDDVAAHFAGSATPVTAKDARAIREARMCQDAWVDAIASLARRNLLE